MKNNKEKDIKKELINYLNLKNIRELNQLQDEDFEFNFENDKQKENLIISKPCEIFEEWPDQEKIKSFNEENDKIQIITNKFIDDTNSEIRIPDSLENLLNLDNIKWLPPEEYLVNQILLKEIRKKFPNKNVKRFVLEVKDYFYNIELTLRKLHERLSKMEEGMKNNMFGKMESEKNYPERNDDKDFESFVEFSREELNKYRNYQIDNVTQDLIDLFNDYSQKAFTKNIKNNIKVDDKYLIITDIDSLFSIKRDFYKSFYQSIEKEITFDIVDKIEHKEKIERTLNTQNTIKSNNIIDRPSLLKKREPVPTTVIQNVPEYKITYEINSGNLKLDREESSYIFNRWISSIFQMIKDIKINDIETNKNIIYNIYPQKDDTPVISKTGKYWIKLYHMGRPRKIEIDDRQPCTSFGEYILPQSEKYEIWPALFTKALMKLYSYKFKSSWYNEIGDISLIYSLTGHYIEKINTNSIKGKILENFFDKFFNEENYFFDKTEYLFFNKINALSCLNLAKEEINKQINTQNNLSNYEERFGLKRNFKFTFRILDENTDYDPFASNEKKKAVPKKRESIVISNGFGKFLKNKKTKDKYSDMKRKPSEKKLGESAITSNTKDKEESQTLINEESEIGFIDSKVKNGDSSILDNGNVNTNTSNISQMQFSPEKGPGIKKGMKWFSKPARYTVLIDKLKTNLNKKTKKLCSSKNLKLQDVPEDEDAVFKQEEDPVEDLIFNISSKKTDLNKVIRPKPSRDNRGSISSNNNLIKLNNLIPAEDAIKRDDILLNFCYSIIEYFDNKKYNMERLKPIDFSDIKKASKETQTNSIYKRLSIQEKKLYLKQLNTIKSSQNEVKNKRINHILQEGRHIHLIKLKSDLISLPLIKTLCKYEDEEIYNTKKCNLNNWVIPPPEFYQKYYDLLTIEENMTECNTHDKENPTNNEKNQLAFKKSSKNLLLSVDKNLEKNKEEIVSNENKNTKIKFSRKDLPVNPKDSKNNLKKFSNKNTVINEKSSIIKKKPFYDETMHNLLEIKTDYHSNDIIEPMIKYKGKGTWISLYELKSIFNNYLVFYNPKDFKNNLNLDNNWIYNYDKYEFNYDFAIIYIHNNYYSETNVDYQVTQNTQEKHERREKESLTMIIFEPNTGIKDICNEINYHISIDIVESESGSFVKNVKLSNFYSTLLLENLNKEKNYFLIIRSFLTPFGFNLNVLTDYDNIEYMNYNDYLCNIGRFDRKTFTINHSNIEKNKNFLLAKFSLKFLSEKSTRMKINLKHNENIVTNQIEIYLMKGCEKDSTEKLNFNCIDIVTINHSDKQEEYFIMFIINSSLDIKSNSMDIEFLFSNKHTELNLLENLQSYKINDENKFDRNGCVFKEILISTTNIIATIEVNVKMNKKIKDKTEEKVTPIIKLSNNNFPDVPEIKKDKDKIRMNLKIVKNEEILFFEEFFDNLLIKNFIFDNEYIEELKQEVFGGNTKVKQKTAKKNVVQSEPSVPQREFYEYKILCKFDLSELDRSQYEDHFNWEIRIFTTSDNFIILKDTLKEDKEIEVRKTFEVEEGRSVMAKTSRFRFLALKNQEKNRNHLSEEEIAVLKSERKKRESHLLRLDRINRRPENYREGLDPNNKNLISPTSNKNKKKQIVSVSNNDIYFSNYKKYENLEARPFQINSANHKSNYIKTFIKYASTDRFIKKGEEVPLNRKIIISDEIRKKKIQFIDNNFYKYEQNKSKELDETEKILKENPEHLKLFYKTTNNFRNQSREGSRNLIRQRDFLRGKIEGILELERNINFLLVQNEFDINYAKILYEEYSSNNQINQNLKDRLFDKIVEKINEFYATESFKLTKKDKNLIIKYIDEIEKSTKFKIDPDILERFRNILKESPSPRKESRF